jgi:hypothetical protein
MFSQSGLVLLCGVVAFDFCHSFVRLFFFLFVGTKIQCSGIIKEYNKKKKNINSEAKNISLKSLTSSF